MVTAPPKTARSTADIESTVAAPVWDGDPLVIQFPAECLTAERLLQISDLNDDLCFELVTDGRLEISFPANPMSDSRSGAVYAQLLGWASSGHVSSSSAGFLLNRNPDQVLSPDASWTSAARLSTVMGREEGYWHVCPDLIVEVRSRGQTVRKQQEKMDEWMRAGARLAWLIDPFTDDGVAWIYREGADGPERQARPDTLSGEDVAEGLVVELAKVWRRSSASE